MSPRRAPRPGRTALLAGALGAVALLTAAGPAPAASPTLYPDLKTEPITFDDLELRRGSGPDARVRLAFDNGVENHGEGPIELRGVLRDGKTDVYQWLSKENGHWANRLAGRFVYHPTHEHTHFSDFADYEVWDLATFNAWVAGGRATGAPRKRSKKVSFCLLDFSLAEGFGGTAAERTYLGCNARVQGISVGWTDLYRRNLPDQNVNLGRGGLPDGSYVLRSVVDPRNRLWESARGLDPARESPEANEALLEFEIVGGELAEP